MVGAVEFEALFTDVVVDAAVPDVVFVVELVTTAPRATETVVLALVDRGPSRETRKPNAAAATAEMAVIRRVSRVTRRVPSPRTTGPCR